MFVQMSPDEQRVCAAWKQAAAELGFGFIPSFSVTYGGESYTYLGLVHNFGGPKGALLAVYEQGHGMLEYPELNGYHVSLLNAASYADYKRQHFIDTLNDLQWFGPDTERPAWYSGKPWTA